MRDIYAASLTFSQGGQGTSASASLTLVADGQSRQLTVEWPSLGDINAGGDVTEWLYSALSRLVTNFDEHTVTHAVVEPHVSYAERITREA